MTFSQISSTLESAPSAVRDLVADIVVRELYDPIELLRQWRSSGEPVDDDASILATEVLWQLEEDSEDCDGPDGDALRLATDLRSNLARELSGQELLGAAQRLKQPSLTETMFRKLLAGEQPRLDGMSQIELLALQNALSWLPESFQSAPKREEITNVLQVRRLLETLGGPDLPWFKGRESPLKTMHSIWQLEAEKRPVLLIEGPGGIGKSLLVARFVQELFDGRHSRNRPDQPDCVIHLDFDRSGMQRANEQTFAAEIGLQMLRQFPEIDRSIADRFAHLMKQSNANGPKEAINSRQRSDFGPDSWELLGDLVHLIRSTAGIEKPKAIFFVDSYERIEAVSDFTAYLVPRIAQQLQDRAGIDLLQIYASRAFLEPEQLGSSSRKLPVGRFSQGIGVDYLIEQAERFGVRLSREQAHRANLVLGGWPLALRLGISILQQSAKDFEFEEWLEEIGAGGEVGQTVLYQRLLDRIQDDNVRRLARPGLLVRRITADLIRGALAKPCHLDLTQTSADEIMRAAQREGQLFIVDTQDPRALWHRRDVRELMLGQLRAAIDPETQDIIHRNVIDCYSGSSDPRDRAEEIYHRLCRGETLEDIRPRWIPEVEGLLVGAASELPAQAAQILRVLLGTAKLVELEAARENGVAFGDDPAALLELRYAVRARLDDQATDIDQIFENAGLPQSAISPLGDLWAANKVQIGEIDEVLASAQMLRSSRKPVPRNVRANVYATAAGVLEGRNDIDMAVEFWDLAGRNSDQSDPLNELSVALGIARSHRKAGRVRAMDAPLQQAVDALTRIDRKREIPAVIVREALAELALWPGAEAARDELLDRGHQIARFGALLPSLENDEARIESIKERYSADLVFATQYNPIGNPSEVYGIVTVRSLRHGAEHPTALIAQDIIREEVDLSLASAIAKKRDSPLL